MHIRLISKILNYLNIYKYRYNAKTICYVAMWSQNLNKINLVTGVGSNAHAVPTPLRPIPQKKSVGVENSRDQTATRLCRQLRHPGRKSQQWQLECLQEISNGYALCDRCNWPCTYRLMRRKQVSASQERHTQLRSDGIVNGWTRICVVKGRRKTTEFMLITTH